MPMNTDKKQTTKKQTHDRNLFSLAKEPEKEQTIKIENV